MSMNTNAPGQTTRAPRKCWPVVWLGLDQVYAYEGGMMNAQLNPGWCVTYPQVPDAIEAGIGTVIDRLANGPRKRFDHDAVILIGPDLAAHWQLGDAPRAEKAGDPRRHPLTDEIYNCSRYHGKLSYTATHGPDGKITSYNGPARAWITVTQGSGLAERHIRLGMVSWMDKDEAAEVGVYTEDPEWTVQTGGAARALLGAPLCQSTGMTGVLSLRADPRMMAIKSGRKVERVDWWPDNWDQLPRPAALQKVELGYTHKREATPAERRSHVMALDMRRACLRGATGIEVARTKLYPQGPLEHFAGRPGYYRIDTRPLAAHRAAWHGMPDPWQGCPQGYAPHERWMPHTLLELFYDLARPDEKTNRPAVIAPEALIGIIEEAWTSHKVERLGPWASDLSAMIDTCAASETTAHLAEILGRVKDHWPTQLGTLVGITQRPDHRDATHASASRKAWLEIFLLQLRTPHLPLQWDRDTVWIPVEPGQLSPLPLEGPHGGPLGGWRVLGEGAVPYEVYAASREGRWWDEEVRRERRAVRDEARVLKYQPKAGPRRVHDVPFSENALGAGA
jgi:hypothetical protein